MPIWKADTYAFSEGWRAQKSLRVHAVDRVFVTLVLLVGVTTVDMSMGHLTYMKMMYHLEVKLAKSKIHM